MLYTTGNLVKQHAGCQGSIDSMIAYLGKGYGWDTPIDLVTIMNHSKGGVLDAIWCLRCTTTPSEKLARRFAYDCSEHVLPSFEQTRPGNKAPRECIEVARRFYIEGKATIDELKSARYAAWAAAAAAWASADAAWASADAARYAADAARYAAWAAAAAAWASADAARDAADAAAAALGTETMWQSQRFAEILST